MHFPKVPPKKISLARRMALCNNIWAHLRQRFLDRSPNMDIWWSKYISDSDQCANAENVIVPNESTKIGISSAHAKLIDSLPSSASSRSDARAFNTALERPLKCARE